MADTTLIVGVAILNALAFIALVAVYAARYKRVPPGHAMVVYGRKFAQGRGYQVYMDGGKFIVPVIESYALLSLELMPFDHVISDVVTDVRANAPRFAHITAIGTARIDDDRDRIQAAAGQLLHKSKEEILLIAVATVEGHVRGVLAAETNPNLDLQSIADRVRSLGSEDLAVMGITIPTLTLRVRPTGRSPDGGAPGLEHVAREMHDLDARLRRIEERLGLTI